MNLLAAIRAHGWASVHGAIAPDKLAALVRELQPLLDANASAARVVGLQNRGPGSPLWLPENGARLQWLGR
jgi:hypothetical protein